MNINTGTLTREVYEICLLNEKQTASPEQTAVAVRLSALGNAVETMERENGVAYETLVKVNAWIAEAKPLLEQGSKAEAQLRTAQGELARCREALIACHAIVKTTPIVIGSLRACNLADAALRPAHPQPKST